MRSRDWSVLGLAASLAVMLSQADAQLGAIQSASARAYDATTYTGPRLVFWDTEALGGALSFWLGDDDTSSAVRLLNVHLALDLVFLPLLAYLLARLLAGLRVEPRPRRRAAGIYLVVDLFETLLTVVAVNVCRPAAFLVVIQVVTLLKWVSLAGIALLAVTSPTARALLGIGVPRAPIGRWRLTLAPQWFLVTMFAALVALPGGGPLEQLPDILRQQLADLESGTLAWATLCVAGFAATIVLSGAVALRHVDDGSSPRRFGDVQVLAVGVGITAVLGAVQAWREAWTPVTLAPTIVLVTVWAAARWRDKLSSRDTSDHPTAAATPPAPPAVDRLGAIGGAVGMIAGLGLVRAAGPYLLLDVGDQIRATIALVAGIATTALSVWIARAVLRVLARRLGAEVRELIMLYVAIVVVLASVVLAVRPSDAGDIGANGVLAVWLSLASIVIAGFQALSRRVAWPATASLGLGSRTPWGALVAATYVVASVINTAGGYHDVRVLAPSDESAERYVHSGLDEALTGWLANGCDDPEGPRPMVIVAAPGGGIRAALWTAAGLDTIFQTECARDSLFAISGASGGSVGATVWQAAPKDRDTATEAVVAMSGPDPLAAGIAGMLFRDLVQPFTGLTEQWRDRAALIEDEWIDAARVLGTVDDPTRWAALDNGSGWTPVLVLNSSSVTDGCRIIVSNTERLPTSQRGRCNSTSTDVGGGPITGALDPLAMLREVDAEGGCGSGELSAVGAALLSARFPYVTPSGALHTCVTDGRSDGPTSEATVFAVDGGYIENSGILAAIEIVDEITNGHHAGEIEPWILVLDNHYRSTAIPPTPPRPREFLVPLQTLQNRPNLSQIVLEEMAAQQLWDAERGCTRLIRVAPAVRPDLAAPLGWTLSTDTANRLLDAMESSYESMSQPPRSPDGAATACSAELLTNLAD